MAFSALGGFGRVVQATISSRILCRNTYYNGLGRYRRYGSGTTGAIGLMFSRPPITITR